jgi:phosphatidylinositol glycan class F
MASTSPAGLQSHSHQTLLHSILILFSLAFLPRSNYPYKVGPPGSTDAPVQTKSADKPQAGWLNPITLNPTSTLLWWILGAVIIAVFRAGWVRRQYSPPRGKDHRSGQSGKAEETKARGKALSIRLIQALATIVILTPVTTILLILLGAPLTADSTKASLTPSPLTPLLALLLNTLVLFIPFYVIGVPLSIIKSAIASIPGLALVDAFFNSSKLSEGEQVLSEWTRFFRQLV